MYVDKETMDIEKNMFMPMPPKSRRKGYWIDKKTYEDMEKKIKKLEAKFKRMKKILVLEKIREAYPEKLYVELNKKIKDLKKDLHQANIDKEKYFLEAERLDREVKGLEYKLKQNQFEGVKIIEKTK